MDSLGKVVTSKQSYSDCMNHLTPIGAGVHANWGNGLNLQMDFVCIEIIIDVGR